MPIRIKDNMPVIKHLEGENIFVMPENIALRQDIRQLKIAVVNIMPIKEQTELQLLRLLSNTPLQTDVVFVRLVTHEYKNISDDYLSEYYKSFDEIKKEYFDGLIITGAPVENLEFEQVDYWGELSDIMEWSKTHVTSVMHICWAAQAGLYYHYGIEKYRLEKKLSGIYKHKINRRSAKLIRGFDDEFLAPHSRYTGVRREDILAVPELEILAESEQAGTYIIFTKGGRQIFINGHPEYDLNTLAGEYFRDVNKGIDPDVPVNYFPDDDPSKEPVMSWRGHANLLFSNWLNYFVYQITPYDLELVGDPAAFPDDLFD